MAEPTENQNCSDCFNRLSCGFNGCIPKGTCGLYESDTEFVKAIIDGLSHYLGSKQKDNLEQESNE